MSVLNLRTFAVVCSLVAATPSLAADYTTEYEKKIKASQDVGVLGPSLAGDHTSYYTGATGFSATDISIPGNGMGISLSRSYKVEWDRQLAVTRNGGPNQPTIYSNKLRMFGDWDLDVPHISTEMTQSSGWIVDSGTPTNRCSVVGQTGGSGQTPAGAPPYVATAWWAFEPAKYWSGYTLHAGGSDQTLLVASLTNNERPSTGGPYHWTTNGNWWVSCLTSLVGPLQGSPAVAPAGQGFLAISPDGTKYWFNHLSKRFINAVGDRAEFGPNGSGQPHVSTVFRSEYLMLPTRIEDRFGNWTTYAWSSDTFSKLNSVSVGPTGSGAAEQTITLHYSSSTGFVDWASDGTRTWNYAYSGDSLTEVTLPRSGSEPVVKWQYSLSTLNALIAPTPQCYTELPPESAEYFAFCQGYGYVGNLDRTAYVIHPSGARIDFVFDTHFQFQQTSFGSHPLGLESKTLSGPGLTTATWKFGFGPGQSAWNSGAARIMSDELAPDGSLTRRIFSVESASHETLQVAEYQGSTVANVSGGSPAITTTTRWGVDYLDDASPTTGTVPTFYKATDYSYVPVSQSLLPFTQRVGVNPLQSNESPPQTFASERRIPQFNLTQSLQAATFQSNVPATCGTGAQYCFSIYGQPTTRVLASSLEAGVSRTEVTTYTQDTAKWVLNQVAQVNCVGNADCGASPGKIMQRVEYDASTRLPWKSFGYDQVNPEATLTYNTNGSVATAKDARNNVTTILTYKRGIPTSVLFPDGATMSADISNIGLINFVVDRTGSKTCYDYDTYGRPTRVTYTSEANVGVCDTSTYLSTSISFAAMGSAEYGIPAGHWRRTVTTGFGQTDTYYDALWQPLVSASQDTQNVVATRSLSVTRYDTLGRNTFTSYPVGSLTSYTDALTGTRTTYDALGRVTLSQQDAGATVGASVLNSTTAYPGSPNPFQTVVTNPRGFSTTTSYRAYDTPSTDLPRAIALPEGVSTTIDRQPSLGKPKTVTRSGSFAGSPLSLARGYVYDANERLCQTLNPESGTTIVSYDVAGNLDWSAEGQTASGITAASCAADRAATAAGAKTTRAYDAMNRVTLVTTPGNIANVATLYEADGKVKQLTTNQPGTDTVKNFYYYNRRRLLTQEKVQVNANGAWQFDYAYNNSGHLSSQTYPGALVVGYAPDALGRPTQAGTFARSVTYFPNGAISSFVYGNDIVHTMTQNDRKLPARSLDAFGATKFLDDTYTYDGNGNVLSMADAANTGLNDRTWGVAAPTLYDGLDRLLSVRGTNWGSLTGSYNALYSYDALDNIRSAKIGAAGYTHAYDVGGGTGGTNRLVSMQLNGGTTYALGTDAAGNITSDARSAHGYQFDVAHRLNAVTGPGAESYLYDGHGRRARSLNSTTGTIEYFGYGQDGRLLQDWSNRRNVRNGYVYLGNTLVGLHEVNITTFAVAPRYKHTDALGSPVATTDSAKNVTTRTVYTPYGIPMTPVDGVGYTGHFNDVGTGLTYMQQRYYDPAIGRFLSIDPVAASGSTGANFNRYWYANSNPYRFTDPDGRVAMSMPAGVVAAADKMMKPVTVVAASPLSNRDNKAIAAFSKSISLGREKLAKAGNIDGLAASFGTDHVYRQEVPSLVTAAANNQENGNEPMGYRDDSAPVPTIVALPRWGELADRSVTTGNYHGMTLGRGGDRSLTKGYLHELGHIVDKMNGTRPTDIERSANEFVNKALEE